MNRGIALVVAVVAVVGLVSVAAAAPVGTVVAQDDPVTNGTDTNGTSEAGENDTSEADTADRADPDAEYSGAGYFNASIDGMAQNRINMYQSYYDMTVLLRSLKYSSDPTTQGGSIVGKFDINKNGSKDTPDRIFFVGNSHRHPDPYSRSESVIERS